MNDASAAGLPEGSVVAHDCGAWIKVAADSWLKTGADTRAYQWQVQDALDSGATVLRVGR